MATTTRSISSSSVEGHLVSVAVEEGMHEAENVPPLLFRKRLLFRGVGRERGETFSLFSCAPKKPVVLPKSFLRCLILIIFSSFGFFIEPSFWISDFKDQFSQEKVWMKGQVSWDTDREAVAVLLQLHWHSDWGKARPLSSCCCEDDVPLPALLLARGKHVRPQSFGLPKPRVPCYWSSS